MNQYEKAFQAEKDKLAALINGCILTGDFKLARKFLRDIETLSEFGEKLMSSIFKENRE